MNYTRIKTLSNLTRILCAVAVIAIALISVCVYHASAKGLFLFLIYILFFINIPGAFVLRQFKLDINNISVRLLLSLFTGWAMIVAEYFISSLLGNSIVPYLFGPLLSAAYFIDIYRNKTSALNACRFNPRSIPAGLYIAFVLIMIYVFIRTQFLYMSPDLAQSITVSTDKAYQMGLVNSLSHGYPLVNPWIAGRTVHYHIFSQILYAVSIRLFGLTSDFLVMSCGPYLTTYSLALAYYSLFRVFSRKPQRAGLYTLSIVLSHMFISKKLTSSYTFKILFVNNNYGGYGVAAALAWLILLKICLDRAEDHRLRISDIVILSAIMMLVTGIKAPIGLVLTGGLIGTWLLGLIMRECKLRSAIPVAVISCAFLLVYKVILAGSGSSESNGQSIFGFGHLTTLCYWKRGLVNFLTQHSVPGTVRLAIVMIIFMAFFLTAFLLPFAVGYIRELVLVLRRIKPFNFSRVLIYAVAVVGLVMSLCLKYSGHSEIYFALILTGLAPLISFWFFEDMEDDMSAWMHTIGNICRYIFFIVLIITSVSFVAGNLQREHVISKHARVDAHYHRYRSITAEEYEAMLWLRDNTPENSLIATHKHSNVAPRYYTYKNRWGNCHFLYSVYSNRFFYHEGSGFSLGPDEWTLRKDMIETNAKLYDAANDARGDLARELGVSYVVLTKSKQNNADLSNVDYELCFSNKKVNIYKITE